MKIVHFPHPALVTKSNVVTQFDTALAIIAQKMIELMHEAKGVGLAANQVGLSQRIFVMQCDPQKSPYIFINPEIVETSEDLQKYNEGCLSFPSLSLEISRKAWVTLKWQDITGKFKEDTFHGLEAICIQHEGDHLDGINFIERVGSVKKMMAMKKYTSFKKKN